MANIPLGNFGNVMPQAQAGRVLDTGAGQVAQAVGNVSQVAQQYAVKEQKIQEEKDQYQFNIEASKYGAEYQDYITETKQKLVTGEYDEATAKAYLRQRTDELAQNYVGRIPEKQKERFNFYSEKMYNDSQAGIKPLAYETERRSINADFEQVGEATLKIENRDQAFALYEDTVKRNPVLTPEQRTESLQKWNERRDLSDGKGVLSNLEAQADITALQELHKNVDTVFPHMKVETRDAYKANIESAIDRINKGLEIKAKELDKEHAQLHAITLEVIQQKQQQETINRINGDNEVALSSREYTDFMLRMNNTNPSIFSGISDNIVITEKGETQRQLNNKMITNGEFPKVLGERSIRLDINTAKSSFRYGLNDPLPLDNNTNMFKGLTNKDAWADENLGIGSVAFGRNGASYAYLSTTYGHDCITYGVASTAGGAGSGTGNPDLPNDGANYGYCSLAHGKDTLAKGRISTAFGEQCVAGSIYSYSSGRESISGEGLSTHPNLLGGSGVVSEGRGAFTHGYRCYAYGNDSIAFGSSVTAYNGAQIIGTGINVGSPLLNSLPNSIAFGRNVDVPTILIEGTQGNGVNNAFGKVGFNTKRPKERVEIVVNNQDKVAIRSKNGGASFDLQGTLGTGDSTSIFRIEYTSPNGGQAYGTTNFYQNNQNWLSLNESGDPTFKKVVDSLYGYRVDGTKVIGGQLNPITSLETTATLEQTINKINEVIVALRSHGLIAT